MELGRVSLVLTERLKGTPGNLVPPTGLPPRANGSPPLDIAFRPQSTTPPFDACAVRHTWRCPHSATFPTPRRWSKAMTSRCIPVTSLRHLQPSTIASLLKEGLVYDTGRKRWCRKCRAFEIVLAFTPDGRRLTRADAPKEQPSTSSFGLF